MLADEPKIAGIPITTGVPVFFLTSVGLIIGVALPLFLIGAAISVMMHVKFGGLPIRLLFSVIYWSLPRVMTYGLFNAFPDSSHRLFIR